MSVPITIYVDALNEEKGIGVTLDKHSVIYNLHTLNNIRNSQMESSISLEAESPVVRAGKYIAVKQTLPDDRLTLTFLDPIGEPATLAHYKALVGDSLGFIMESIKSYIADNYDIVSKEIVLKVGRIVAAESRITVNVTHPIIKTSSDVVLRLQDSINKLLAEIRTDLIRTASVITIQEGKEKDNPMSIEIITHCPDPILSEKVKSILGNFLAT